MKNTNNDVKKDKVDFASFSLLRETGYFHNLIFSHAISITSFYFKPVYILHNN